MIDTLILRVEYQGSIHDLPVNSKVPLRLDVSAVENGEIGKFFGVGSQAFDIPGTKEVNRFFNYGYDVSVDDIPAMYNTLPCSVILNGETILQGELQLLEIVTGEQGNVNYKVQVSDNTIQFNNNLSSKLLVDLNLDAYDHNLTCNFITSSWWANTGAMTYEGTGSFELTFPPLDGVIFYPLADYGTDGVIPFPTQPKIFMESGSASTKTGSIDNSGTPMLLKQFQPSIRVPELMTAVFEQAGFSYVSSFIDEKCNNMYVLPKGDDALGIVLDSSTLVGFQGGANINQVVTGTTEYNVVVNTESLDTDNAFNTTTYEYTVPVESEYTFNGSVSFYNPLGPTDTGKNISVVFYLVIETGGTPIFLDGNIVTVDSTSGPGPFNLSVTYTDQFAVGVKLKLYGSNVQLPDGTPAFDMQFIGERTSFSVTEVNAYEGALVKMALQFDPQSKSIDFLKGFVQQYNLVIVPEPNQDRVLRIETLDEWIRRGERKDWTFRFDTAKRISINHTVDEQPNQILFQGEEDADRISTIYLESVPNYPYSTVRTLADSNIPLGDLEVGSFFGPLAVAPMISSSFFINSNGTTSDIYTNELSQTVSIVPHLYKFDNNNQKTYKFKPRIGYKSGYFTPMGWDAAAGQPANDVIYIENLGGVEFVQTYSTLTPCEFADGLYPSQVFGTYILPNGGNTNFDSYDTTYMPSAYFQQGVTTLGVGAYQRYWETYMNSLYWEGSKKVTLDLYFEPYEYKSILLNDQITIKNQVYRINKIKGFNISYPDVVTVELIKLYPEYIAGGDIIPFAPPPWPLPTPPPAPRYWNVYLCSDPSLSFVGVDTTGETLANGSSIFSGTTCYEVGTETTTSGMDSDISTWVRFFNCAACNA